MKIYFSNIFLLNELAFDFVHFVPVESLKVPSLRIAQENRLRSNCHRGAQMNLFSRLVQVIKVIW